MKKLIGTAAVATALLITLSGCVTTASAPKDSDAVKMTPKVFVDLFSSGNSLTGNSGKPKVGETYYWNPGDSKFSDKGQYSVVYSTLNDNGDFAACYEDSKIFGSFQNTGAADDPSSHFAVSFKNDCANFTPDAKFKGVVSGPGQYDLKIVTSDKKKTTEPYVKELQKYEDQMAKTSPKGN